MKRYRLVLTVSVAALLIGGTTVASEIYKWTDDDGNAHYEDRPIAGANIDVSTSSQGIRITPRFRHASAQMPKPGPLPGKSPPKHRKK